MCQARYVCNCGYGSNLPLRFKAFFSVLYLQPILNVVKDLLHAICTCIHPDMSAQCSVYQNTTIVPLCPKMAGMLEERTLCLVRFVDAMKGSLKCKLALQQRLQCEFRHKHVAPFALKTLGLACMLQSNMKVMQKGEKQQSRAAVARPKLRRHGNTAKGRSARVVSNVDCRVASDTPLQG